MVSKQINQSYHFSGGDDLDTGTHLLYGLSLAGLAHIDPAVSGDPSTAVAVLIGTLAGQQAPDFDQILRVRGNAAYIRNHRGASHSIPAVLLWTAGITGSLMLFFDNLPWLHVGLWVFIAIALHVFTDLFNTYGTQALRPFSDKWISWNIIHIFDPTIFALQAAGIILWAVQAAPPQHIFIVVYSLLFLYYLWRTIIHNDLEKKLKEIDPDYKEGNRYTLIPTVALNVWNVVKQLHTGDYVTGELRNGKLRWMEKVKKIEHPAVEASKKSNDIQALLYFSPYTAAELHQHPWGYEVHWFDVRYRHRKQYPFIGVVILDRNLEIKTSYVGWLSSDKLEKKLSPHIRT